MTAGAAKHVVRPYGDRRDDGVVQLSFVLPVTASEKAKEAARQFVKKMGFQEVLVSHMETAGEGYTMFVCYGRTHMYLDYNEIEVPELKIKKLSFDALNDAIEKELGRKIVVVGGCTGTDAHAVGIDAIMNMKGYAQDYGLERYRMFDALNMGSQVENDAIVAKALELKADAILVSQVVTQRDVHKDNARQLVDLLAERGLKGRFLLLLGGPRIDHKLALELGFDAGFGPGTRPSDVANFLFYTLKDRQGLKTAMPVAQPVTIRLRMSQADAHYGGNLVDGARMLALFGDVATELLIRHDGDEGLFRAYDAVEFLAPVHAGDYVEVTGEIVEVGRTSRKMRFEARKVIHPLPGSDSACEVLDPPVVVCRASGTCVTPLEKQRGKG